MATGEYDDAWETPGWTAQNFNYPDPAPTFTAPTGLKNVKVKGSFFDHKARPLWGKFTFQPSVRSVRVGGSTVVLTSFSTDLKNGQLDVNILSPDNVVTSPPAWSYKVRQRVGPVSSVFEIQVPISGTEVDVYDLQVEEPSTIVNEFPLVRDFTVYAGSTFRREFVWANGGGLQDLSTWTAKMQIRTAVGGALLLELTQGNGISLTAAGEVVIEITAEQASALQSGVYDLELYEPVGQGGDTVRFLQGSVTVNPNVTV